MKKHDSMRGYFAYELYKHMQENENIYLVTADLGYGMFDDIRRDFKDRFINCGAAEQLGMGIAIGLAQEGKIPFFYSITNFAIYRPYEWIRNYVDYQDMPVRIIGGGRNKDYSHDGISHWSDDVEYVLKPLTNIFTHWPEDKKEIPGIVDELVAKNKPHFLSLRR